MARAPAISGDRPPPVPLQQSSYTKIYNGITPLNNQNPVAIAGDCPPRSTLRFHLFLFLNLHYITETEWSCRIGLAIFSTVTNHADHLDVRSHSIRLCTWKDLTCIGSTLILPLTLDLQVSEMPHSQLISREYGPLENCAPPSMD